MYTIFPFYPRFCHSTFESGPEIRPRQPESEPGSEPVDRNVRPRLAPHREVTQPDEVGNNESTTQTRGDVGQTPDEAHVDNPSGDASAISISYPLVSASNYLTVLPVETEFDSKAQAVVHGSDDAVTERDSTTFEAIEGMAVFDSETKSFWVAPRPKDKSGVVYDELSETDKKKFDASRFKEIDNLLKLNALSVMSPKESDHFAKTTPENIIPTNMLDKWKFQDDGTVAAKSRSVLVDWKKDPMILPVGACCTHSDAGKYHGDTSVVGISKGDRPHSRSDQWIRIGSQDIKKNKLATKLPSAVTHPKVGPGQMLRVEREIYGLVSGPSWLRASSTVDLLAAGYKKIQYDKCLFTLFSSDETSEGQLLLDVDDFIEGGNEIHRETMKGFYDKYRCGKAIDLRLAGQGGTRFAGRRVVQHPDFRIAVSMDEYVKSKLREDTCQTPGR